MGGFVEQSSSVVAVTKTTVACMRAATFRETVHAYSDICDQLLAPLTGQIRMLANRVFEASTLDARSRIRAELLRLAYPAPETPDQAKISPPPYQSEIAARVGVRREAVSRELNALVRNGIIERRRTAIVIKSSQAFCDQPQSNYGESWKVIASQRLANRGRARMVAAILKADQRSSALHADLCRFAKIDMRAVAGFVLVDQEFRFGSPNFKNNISLTWPTVSSRAIREPSRKTGVTIAMSTR